MIDDDTELCELVGEYLRREGMEVDCVHTGEEGLNTALTGHYTALVLDVMLPGIGGFEVLRRLRSEQAPGSQLAVLMLTARGDEVDRVLGLEIGADDYLPKPFSSRELAARLRAILRRTQTAAAGETSVERRSERLTLGDLDIDVGARLARVSSEIADLTSVEYKLLEILVRSAIQTPGEVVTREQIALDVLGRSLLPYDRSIDTHVSNLRRKLGPDPAGRDRIKTVRSFGYVYTAGDGTTNE
jgi:two-component system response regulator CpxR